MPFEPVNYPDFYTCVMGNFRLEQDALFIESVTTLATSGVNLDDKIVSINGDTIFLDEYKLTSGTRSIIDNILIWSSNIPYMLLYLECVYRVFQTYRVSFRLDKCDFLKERAEFLGHELTANGNCPAANKFNMIKDWALPVTGKTLYYFVSIVIFYRRYAPYLKMRIKSLRRLLNTYFRKEILAVACSPELVDLFRDAKVCITSLPILAPYNPGKLTCLKTDWSAEGMGYILIQSANDETPMEATSLLLKTGECIFGITKSGARLQHVLFDSR